MKKKLRPLGRVTLDLESVVDEMALDHELEWGEIMALVFAYMQTHLPESKEQFLDGDEVEFYYGPRRKK